MPTDGFLDWGGLPFVPIHTRSWPFRGTGLRSGVPVPAELVGYEIDSFDPNYPAPDAVWRKLLAASPFVNFAGNDDYVHNMSIYGAHSGALVWATGTMDWSWGLAPEEQRRRAQQRPALGPAADRKRPAADAAPPPLKRAAGGSPETAP